MIKLVGVSKVYKTGVHALNDMNLNIEPGEFVYVIGPTGAGKSTFIKLLYREEVATSGKVLVAGVDVSKIKNRKVPYFRRNIGVVFQNFRLLKDRTVFENVAFAMEVFGYDKAQIQKRVLEVLDLVGLKNKVRQYPTQLSGGEQQRVVIARAIVNKPKLLISHFKKVGIILYSSKVFSVIFFVRTISPVLTIFIVSHPIYIIT